MIFSDDCRLSETIVISIINIEVFIMSENIYFAKKVAITFERIESDDWRKFFNYYHQLSILTTK